jgi:protein-disulfide isomerase
MKKKYIDTGKVKYILREFPLDPLAAAGFMLALLDSSTAAHFLEQHTPALFPPDAQRLRAFPQITHVIISAFR